MKLNLKWATAGLFIFYFSLFGCGKDNPADKLFDNVKFVGVPINGGQLSIAITDPIADGSNVSYSTTISGTCGVPGKVVEIGGDVTAFSACLANLTWSVNLDLSQSPLGNVRVEAYLVGDLLASGARETSTASVRIFNKLTSDCDTAAQRTAVFANIATGGNGVGVPYSICTGTQLSNIRLNAAYLTSRFNIYSDLVFTGTAYVPIPGHFGGEVEGNGFRIVGLQIPTITSDEIGLFQYLRAATISNIRFTDVNIFGRNQVGILAGRARGPGTITINNVTFAGAITATTHVGGLFGYIDLLPTISITDVTSNVTISASGNYVGGLVGRMLAGTTMTMTTVSAGGAIQGIGHVGGVIGYAAAPITLSTVTRTGAITTTGTYVGGLIGRGDLAVTVSNATVSGNISTSIEGGSGYGGGLAGTMGVGSSISTCSYTGDIVFGTSYVGGIVADMASGSISNCTFLGNIQAVDGATATLLERIGGIVGNNSNVAGVIISSSAAAGGYANSVYSTGTITTGGRYVGGLGGVINTNSTITDSFAKMNVSGYQQRVAGLVGSFSGASITNSTATGDITVADAAANTWIGGLVGLVATAGATISTATFNGTITMANNVAVPNSFGGLVGEFRGASIQNASANANITVATGTSLGGLVGNTTANNVQILNSYSTGSISGAATLGGLVGSVTGTGATVSSSYATGSVTGTGNSVGGLIGNIGANGTINGSSYAVGAISGNANVGGLVGITSTGMTVTSVFATGAVSGSSTSIGGLIGYLNSNSTVTSSYAQGVVTGSVGYVGGFIGQPRQNVDITDSYATGNVSGNGNYVGGLEGGSDQTLRDLLRVYATGSVNNPNVAGFTGGLSGRVVGNLTFSFATGNVTASGQYVGGLVGYHQGLLNDSFYPGTVQGPDSVGGIVGYENGGISALSNLYFSGTVVRATGGAAVDRFGPITGGRAANNRVDATSYFRQDASGIVVDQATGLPYATANALGTLRTTAQLTTPASVPGLDFIIPNWKIIALGYPLYGTGTTYFLPVLNWM